MHHRRHRHRGFRRPYGLGRGWYDREEVLERLEEGQRDLEQELAERDRPDRAAPGRREEPQTTTV